MDTIVDDYKCYYRCRYERVASNPDYPLLAQAERELRDAICACGSVEEMSKIDPRLPQQCAIAQTLDVAAMENRFYNEQEETVRARSSAEVLAKASRCEDAVEVGTLVSEAETGNNAAVSMDEAVRNFDEIWDKLDEMEIYRKAEVPEEYRPFLNDIIRRCEEQIRDIIADTEASVRVFDRNWRYRPETVLEQRHIRFLPYTRVEVEEMVKRASAYL